MKKIKIGLIGFGSWVRSAYLPALNCDERAEITAVTASSNSTRQLARQTLGNDIAVFESYEELLQKAEINAVMIAVPDMIHQPALSAALNTDLAVFYEPPISHIRTQIPVMLDKLLAAEQVTFAHLELGFHPAIARAKEIIKSNAIGLLQNITITLHADWGCPDDSDLCLINRMSSWYIDVLNQLADSIPSQVLLLDGSGNTGRLQPSSMGIYKYNNVWGIFKANVCYPSGLSLTVDIDGDCGNISIDFFNSILQWCTNENPQPVSENISPLKPYADYPGVREAVSAFLDAAASGNVQNGNARKVAQLNLIGMAAEESRDTGLWTPIKIL